jgi:hypothetical protein
MIQFTHYLQECPVCGRPLRIRPEYSGQPVICLHCRGQFVASEPADADGPRVGRKASLLERAEALIQRASAPSAAEPKQSGSWLLTRG